MSDLLIILVALGVLIVLGVLFFNWRQERQYQDKMSENFKPTERDVLVEDFQIDADLLKNGGSEPKPIQEKIEPSFDSHFEETSTVTPASQPAAPQTTTTSISTALEEATPELTLADNETESATTSRADEISSFGDTMTLEASSFEVAEDADETTALAPESEPETSSNLLPEAVHLQTDLIGILYATEPLVAEQVAALNDFNAVTHHFGFGQTTEHEWIALNQASGESFNKLLYAMQMADRGGPVAREIIHAFQQKIESIGSALGAQVEWQNKGDPAVEAIALDQFCIEVDKTIGFHVIAKNGQFHGTKFRGLVESQGLSLQSDGRYVMASASEQEDYYVKNFEGKTLSNDMLKTAVMTGVTFQLDLPTVANSSDVFDKMIACAKSIAASLDAEIVDDKRKAIGDIQFEKIREQLNVINAQMIAKGIIPGSVHALRLFS